MDTDKFIRQIREQATEHIKSQLRERIETIYCPEHGHFAELGDIRGDLTSSANTHMEFSYTTCCEAQMERVRLAVGMDGG